MKIRSFGYWFNHLFFTLGILWIGTLLHELWHFVECGGGFIAGFYYLESKWGFGVTHCERGGSGEVIPYLITFVFLGLMMYLKIKSDIRNGLFK
jgi:hypothetical protein